MSVETESVTRSTKALWTGIIVFAIIVVSIVVIALATPREDDTYLSPLSTRSDGTGALAAILESQGVDVTHVTSWTNLRERASESTTIVLPSGQAQYTDPEVIDELLGTGAPIVIIGQFNHGMTLTQWGLDGAFNASKEGRARASCSHADARAAGGVGPVDQVFQSPLNGCFPLANGHVWVEATDVAVEVITDASILTNEKLAEPGNATFALRRLGSREQVLWLSVDAIEDSVVDDSGSPHMLMPSWYPAAGFAILLGGGWLALYRSRRFGKLIAEPLPVVVPAHEADLGRARLYQRGRNFSHAAQALRAGAISRLAPVTGLRKNATRHEVIAALSSTSGMPIDQVTELFYLRAIQSETDLMNLARELDAFVKEITA